MKKVFSLLAVLALVVMASSSVWAAAFATKAARATFTAEPLSFTVNLYHWGGSGVYETGQTTAQQINFDAADVNVGSTSPSSSISSDYALIHSNLRKQPANTTVYLYTNNTANTSDFKAVSAGPDGFNGLVRKGQNATYKDGDYATIQTKCVQISSANVTYNTTNGPKDAQFLADEQYNGDRWLQDRGNTTTFVNDQNIIGKSGVGGGIWYSAGEDKGTPYVAYSDEDVVMFFKANFNNVAGGDEYGTDTITFNQTVE